jgi:hypothetical protein
LLVSSHLTSFDDGGKLNSQCFFHPKVGLRCSNLEFGDDARWRILAIYPWGNGWYSKAWEWE